jgi:hypothetical protein
VTSIPSLDVTIGNFYIRSSGQTLLYRRPFEIHNDIDLGEWKRSLEYNDVQINNLMGQILSDFGLDQTDDNIALLKATFDNLISLNEREYERQLPTETHSKKKNFFNNCLWVN